MAYWSDIVHPSGAKRPRVYRWGGHGRWTLGSGGDSGRGRRQRSKHESARVCPQDARRLRSSRGDHWRAQEGDSVAGLWTGTDLRAFLKRFIADTAAYLFNDTKRHQIRQRLIAELPPPGTPVTIVAHSQGSIVAVEVLSQTHEYQCCEARDDRLTPRACRRYRTTSTFHRGRSRSGFRELFERWHNFADPLDPVALDKTLAGDFVVRPGSHDTVIFDATAITDEIIVNERTLRFREFNPHSAVGYLSHPKVRRSVYESAHCDSMARFVVARDVAEVLGVDQRHPVLIEALEPGYPALGETSRRT